MSGTVLVLEKQLWETDINTANICLPCIIEFGNRALY